MTEEQTTETKPATDEMKMWRDLASVSGLISATFSGEQIRGIVALVDAERERADKAEALLQQVTELARTYRNQGIAVADQLELAQQQITALREALGKLLQVNDGVPMTGPEAALRIEAARAVLAQTDKGES